MNAPLERVTEICLALPETSVEYSGSHATYRVRKKVFAYFLDNHHGDGIVSVSCKTPLGENFDLAKRDPKRFYIPAYIGPRGWVALRLDRGRVKWDEAAELIRSSYQLVAPKTLASRVR